MNPLNEESKGQQLPKAPNDLSNLSPGVMPVQDASTMEDRGPVMKPKNPGKRDVDGIPKEEGESGKSRRVGQRKAGEEQSIVSKDTTTPALKPAHAKRAQKQKDTQVTIQAEPVSRPKRASSSRKTKEVDALTMTVGDANDVPPLTASAIKYLGKKNATLADYIKLDPDSLAFVRHHLNRMHHLDAGSRSTGEYSDAKKRPVSPSLQRFADARGKDLEQNHGNVAVHVLASPIETVDQAHMRTAVLSYGQIVTGDSAYPSVVVQLRKFQLATRKAGPDIEAGEVALDDSQRMHRVLGTAQILLGKPMRQLTLIDAADLVASDVKELRAIQDESARRLALSAMMDSGLAQPLYHAEFARQASDLVELAAQAYKTTKADWGLTYEALSNLSNLVDSEMPLTKDETAELARRTIATVRAIEFPQYREQVLAASHQAALWHPQYRTEFAHNAPDLVAIAEVAYRAEASRTPVGSKTLQVEENSIEQSPLLVVTKAQPVHQNDQAAAAVHGPSSAEKIDREFTVSKASDGAAAPSPVGHPGLGERLLRAIEGAANQANTWLSIRRQKSIDSAGNMPMSQEKSTSMPVLADDKSSLVPESVARRFLKVESEYYFQDRTPAFSDCGSKLATRGANLEIVRSMVEIAKARGWGTITVKGTEAFRRSAWMEATQDGLTVAGYKPTSLDLAALANRPASNIVEKGVALSEERLPMQPQARRSFAQADNARSKSVHQAKEMQPAPAGLRPEPQLVGKAKAFEEGNPTSVVKKYPDLAKAYGIVAAAKAFASEKLPEASREEFIKMARRHIVEKITAGQQIQGPKIYSEPTKIFDARDQVKGTTEAVDRERRAGTKAVSKEQ